MVVNVVDKTVTTYVGISIPGLGGYLGLLQVQGYLAHKKQRPPRTLQWDCA
jgi:hypothetical protein